MSDWEKRFDELIGVNDRDRWFFNNPIKEKIKSFIREVERKAKLKALDDCLGMNEGWQEIYIAALQSKEKE